MKSNTIKSGIFNRKVANYKCAGCKTVTKSMHAIPVTTYAVYWENKNYVGIHTVHLDTTTIISWQVL